MLDTKPRGAANFKNELRAVDLLDADEDLFSIAEKRPLSVEEAVQIVYEIHVRLEAIEDYRLRLNWWIGYVVSHTHRPKGMKSATVESIGDRLAKTHGIQARRAHLYQCLRLYDGFSGDLHKYLEWIESRKRLYGRPVYWYDVLNDLLGGSNNPAVIGREEADRRDYLEAERAIEAIERIVARAHEGSEEAVGVIEGIRQSLSGCLLLGDPVKKTPRSQEYLAFVAEHACLVCGSPAEAHHALGERGVGQKPSDFGTVPFCRTHHAEMHRSDTTTFETRYGISMMEAALNLIHCYITRCWLTMTLQRVRQRTSVRLPSRAAMPILSTRVDKRERFNHPKMREP